MILGIGTDIIEINRMEKVGVDRLADRILTETEREGLPPRNQRKKRCERLAGRFAAKEAISKAFRCGFGKTLSIRDIEIFSDMNGAPWARISERVLTNMREAQIYLSISHCKNYATAVAIIEKEDEVFLIK